MVMNGFSYFGALENGNMSRIHTLKVPRSGVHCNYNFAIETLIHDGSATLISALSFMFLKKRTQQYRCGTSVLFAGFEKLIQDTKIQLQDSISFRSSGLI